LWLFQINCVELNSFGLQSEPAISLTVMTQTSTRGEVIEHLIT